MLATCDGFLLLLHNLAFRKVSERLVCCFFSFLSVSFLVSCVECPNSLCLDSFNLQQSFCRGFQWTTGHLVMSYHHLGSMLRLMLGLMDVLLHFGFSGHTTWIWQHDGSCSSSVVASEDFSLRNLSVGWFCLICCNISTKQPISGSAVRKFRFGAIQFIIFRRSFDWGFQWAMRYQLFVLSFVGFTVEAVVEVGESSARVWPFGTRCWGLSAWLI